MAIRIIAKPEAGYRFVNWSGDVDSIANTKATTTVVTMSGDYTIIANFGISWQVIGGIITAVLVVLGLVIFFVRRKRATRAKKQGKRKTGRKKH